MSIMHIFIHTLFNNTVINQNVTNSIYVVILAVMHKKTVSPHRTVIDMVMLFSENSYLNSRKDSNNHNQCEITKV